MAGMTQWIKQWLLPPGVQDILVAALKKKHGRLAPAERDLLQRITLLKDTHCCHRCFILGAGPSIKQQEIAKLVGEMVISVSNTFVHPDYARIRPRYHVLPPIMASHGQNLPAENFVNWLTAMDQGTGDAEMFFHAGDRALIEDHHLFRNRTIHWIDYAESWDGHADLPLDLRALPPVWSVSEVAVAVALYLGFEKIYLLGFDHDWFNGLFNYFYDINKEHAAKPEGRSLPQVDSEFQMRRHADIFRKYKYFVAMKNNIYNANANRNSYVDVFPKVDYDSLFVVPTAKG